MWVLTEEQILQSSARVLHRYARIAKSTTHVIQIKRKKAKRTAIHVLLAMRLEWDSDASELMPVGGESSAMAYSSSFIS